MGQPFDGMGIQHASGNQGYNANAETVQEMVMYTSGITAAGGPCNSCLPPSSAPPPFFA